MQVRSTRIVEGLNSYAAGGSYVAHDNLLEGSGVSLSASSESGDYTADLAANWFASDQKWKASSFATDQHLQADLGSAQEVDCLAIYGHNFGTIGATVTLQYSTSSGGPWTNWTSFTPTDDSTIMVVDTAQTKQHWRLLITGMSAAPVVAVWFLGQAVRLVDGPPEGFRPPTLNREDVIMNHRSEGGEFLGRSLLRTGGRATIDIRFASATWIRQTWEPVRLSAREHPIFYAWNLDSYPDEVVLFYTDGPDSGPQANHGGTLYSHTMSGIAL